MNRTREQWAVIDAKFCATQNSATANWHLIQDAQKDIAELHRERDALLAERDVLKADLERAHRATNSECMDWAREYERRKEVQTERDQLSGEVERLREAELLLLSVCDDLMRHENADVRMVTCIELNNWLTKRAALQGAQP